MNPSKKVDQQGGSSSGSKVATSKTQNTPPPKKLMNGNRNLGLVASLIGGIWTKLNLYFVRAI